jgi:streptomycin 6-kinase
VPLLAERLGARWSRRADSNRRLPDGVVTSAAAGAGRLCASWSRPVLLHGDFEARNILRAGDDLVAIDSPAAVGDPGYDAASWVLSEHDGDAAALRVRVARLAGALDYPAQRIWHWAWPLAVDSLLDKLYQPGWSRASVDDAFAVARLIAANAACQPFGASTECGERGRTQGFDA